jgi:DNA repair protein RadC
MVMDEPQSRLESVVRPRFSARSIARYRLSLVREARKPYAEAALCSTPEGAARFLHELLADAYQEVLGCLLVDTRHRAVGYHVAYTGSLTRITVEPRGLLVPALLANAAAIIAFHNHPSGDPAPSAEDLAFTRRLSEAGDVVGVRLLDHLILGEAPRYTSLRQRGY